MRAHALALTLLERHGVLTKGAVAAERMPGGFAAVYPVLRAMEETGQCRRGYFVEGLGGRSSRCPGRSTGCAPSPGTWCAGGRRRHPQPPGRGAGLPSGPGTAFPAGAAESRPWPGQPARPDDSRRAVVLAAADPAQPYGAALPWPSRPEETATSHRPGRKAGAVVVLLGGELVLYVERGGKTLLSWTDDPAAAPAVRPGARRRRARRRARPDDRREGRRRRASTTPRSPPPCPRPASAHTPRGLRLRG